MVNPRSECPVLFESARRELLETGCYYPNLPINAKIRDVYMKKQDTDEESVCTKQYKSCGRLGAGLMLVWCVKHRECIGFSVLRKAESCKELYDILSTRMRKIPRIIIYDNACNLFEVSPSLTPSTVSTAILYYLLKLPFYAMGFIIRTIRTAPPPSIA